MGLVPSVMVPTDSEEKFLKLYSSALFEFGHTKEADATFKRYRVRSGLTSYWDEKSVERYLIFRYPELEEQIHSSSHTLHKCILHLGYFPFPPTKSSVLTRDAFTRMVYLVQTDGRCFSDVYKPLSGLPHRRRDRLQWKRVVFQSLAVGAAPLGNGVEDVRCDIFDALSTIYACDLSQGWGAPPLDQTLQVVDELSKDRPQLEQNEILRDDFLAIFELFAFTRKNSSTTGYSQYTFSKEDLHALKEQLAASFFADCKAINWQRFSLLVAKFMPRLFDSGLRFLDPDLKTSTRGTFELLHPQQILTHRVLFQVEEMFSYDLQVTLLYSSHQKSLSALKSAVSEISGTSLLLIRGITDSKQKVVFGAFITKGWNVSGVSFGGAGTSLIQLAPLLDVFRIGQGRRGLAWFSSEGMGFGLPPDTAANDTASPVFLRMSKTLEGGCFFCSNAKGGAYSPGLAIRSKDYRIEFTTDAIEVWA